MNFRNRKLVITVRVLLGLMFLGSGISGFYSATHGMMGIPEDMLSSTTSLWSMGIFEMIKATEIVAGLMLVFGIWPALATIFVSPICVGVIVFDLYVAPGYIASGIVISILTAYLGYAYWDAYKALFQKR